MQPFIAGLKDAEREAKASAKTWKPVTDAAKEMGTAFTVAGGAITAAFVGMTKASADYGETLNKVNIQTGITTEKLSALKYMADQEETSFDALTIGLKKMSVTAVQNADAFAGIGVKVKDASGAMRPMDDILLDTAKRFAGMHDETKRTALEVEIFGRSGSDLNSLLLRLGKEGLEPAQQMVRKLNLEMSGPQAKAADDFGDSLREVENAVLGLSNRVAGALIPGLTDASHTLRDGIAAVADFAKEHEHLTQIIALGAGGLTGAGGFLLGLTAIVTIYPKVVVGLEAISAAIGETKLVTAGATLGLSILAEELVQVIGLWKDSKQLNEDIIERRKYDIQNTYAQADALDKLGHHVEQTGSSWEDYQRRVREAMIQYRAEFPKNAAQELEDTLRTAAEMAEIKKKQTAFLKAEDSKIAEFKKSVLQVEDGLFKNSVDEQTKKKKEQEKVLEALYKETSDAQHAVWQAETGMYNAELEAQAKKKKEQGDELIGIQKKIGEFTHSILQVEDNEWNIAHKQELERAKERQKAAEETAQAWKTAMANLSTRTAESLSGMVVTMKFTSQSMIGIAQETAKGMLSAFIAGLIHPLTSALGQIGAGLSNTIMGSIGLGSGPGGSALTGTGISAAIKGLSHFAGAGGSVGEAATSDALGNLTTVGTPGGAGLGSTIAGLATNPYTIAIAAGLAVFTAWEKSQAHHEANTFVKTLQDPLVNNQGTGAINTIADEFFRQANAGTLTTDAAQTAIQGVTGLLSDFDASADKFATGGKDEKLVAGQGRATIDPFVKDLISQMQARAANAISVQVNVGSGMTLDDIINAIKEAYATNRGGLATALA